MESEKIEQAVLVVGYDDIPVGVNTTLYVGLEIFFPDRIQAVDFGTHNLGSTYIQRQEGASNLNLEKVCERIADSLFWTLKNKGYEGELKVDPRNYHGCRGDLPSFVMDALIPAIRRKIGDSREINNLVIEQEGK